MPHTLQAPEIVSVKTLPQAINNFCSYWNTGAWLTTILFHRITGAAFQPSIKLTGDAV